MTRIFETGEALIRANVPEQSSFGLALHSSESVAVYFRPIKIKLKKKKNTVVDSTNITFLPRSPRPTAVNAFTAFGRGIAVPGDTAVLAGRKVKPVDNNNDFTICRRFLVTQLPRRSATDSVSSSG